jgi:uncharacterized circularly permuted ATP-grasp superfamily protein/uncharacterized alpha-E superfamily protein
VSPRPAELLARFPLDEALLTRCQAEADRLIGASLAGHLVHDDDGGGAGSRPDRPWQLDPLPYVLGGEEFDVLAAAVRARVRGLEAVLADLYGPRRTVQDGIVPAEVLSAARRYRMAAVGAPPPPRWLVTYAVDVVRLADGSWRVVQDLTDTPTGTGYGLIDRAAMARVAAALLGPDATRDVASIHGFPAELRHALGAVSPVPSPRIVVFSSGMGQPAYVEHSLLAGLLGFHLVLPADLVVRRGRLWLRTLGGFDRVDVVYRRLADAEVDPLSVAGTTGVPGLVAAVGDGGAVLANAYGAGVLEDPALASYWPAAAEALTGDGLGLAPLAPGDRLATVPSFRDRRLGEAAVVVRLHAVHGPDGVTVMAGGNGRVLAEGDAPQRPTARLAKDVWVLGPDRAAPVIVAPLPQVDLAESAPTRAADAMFWLGRAAERAEAVAKVARVITARRQTDPLLAEHDGGRWSRQMTHVLRVARGTPVVDDAGSDPVVALDAELVAASGALSTRLHALLAEAALVGEYLPVTAGRVLRSLAAGRDRFAHRRAAADELDACVVDLAALTGLWGESTVQGPAWRFGELGRRIERALVVLELVDACVPVVTDAGDRGEADVVAAASLEILLAANESLVAYRRQHRSDVELDAALHLLLAAPENPRSYLACVHRLAEHVAALDWQAGREAVAALAGLVDEYAVGVPAAHRAVLAFADLVHDTWFATPVNPTVVRGRLQ